jgi:hypothetical protein
MLDRRTAAASRRLRGLEPTEHPGADLVRDSIDWGAAEDEAKAREEARALIEREAKG